MRGLVLDGMSVGTEREEHIQYCNVKLWLYEQRRIKNGTKFPYRL